MTIVGYLAVVAAVGASVIGGGRNSSEGQKNAANSGSTSP
jgi:hypothetical protein